MDKTAEGMKTNIGWGSFTVLAIPVKRITVEGNASEELMRVVKETLDKMGYQTVVVGMPSDAPDLPLLSARVDKIFFYNYTWFFPLVVNGGVINMNVSITSPQGDPLWQKDYKGEALGLYDFDWTVNYALTSILNEMIVDMSTPEFKAAVWQGAAGPEEAEDPSL